MTTKIFAKYFSIIFFLLCTKVLTAAELINLTTKDVEQKLGEDALVIDIRTPEEWQRTGIIPGSHPLKFFDKNGKYDAQQWLDAVTKLQTSPDQPIVLVCNSGRRSAKVGHYLTETLNMPNVSHLEHGIASWIKEKRATAQPCNSSETC